MVRLKHTPPQVELGAAVAPAGQVGGEGVARAADTISSSRDTLGQQAAIITGRAGRSPRQLVVVGRPLQVLNLPFSDLHTLEMLTHTHIVCVCVLLR